MSDPRHWEFWDVKGYNSPGQKKKLLPLGVFPGSGAEDSWKSENSRSIPVQEVLNL